MIWTSSITIATVITDLIPVMPLSPVPLADGFLSSSYVTGTIIFLFVSFVIPALVRFLVSAFG